MASREAALPLRRRVVGSAWLPAVLLLGSGFSALVYQSLWLRLLGLVFGVTVHAASTVLAAFMAGLALGSVAGGKLADRTPRPLRLFGAAELLIGLTAFATPLALDALETVYRGVYANVSSDIRVLSLVRLACSFLVLMVPTTLMGATMPLVLRGAVARIEDLGSRAALLYAANTAGALGGALITGYYLVSSIGISGAFHVAAVVNLLVGLTALLWRTSDSPVSQGASARSQATSFPVTPGQRRAVLAVFAASGFVGLALEIVWFRALVMFLPATTYVFTTILAVVLGGIAAGSILATRALRKDRDWIARLSVLQLAIAVAAVASLAAQAWSYSHGWRTGAALQASALSILPTMLLMGSAFPIGLFCWTTVERDADAQAGDRIGRFYLFNLAGAILGAMAAGFLLIPAFGIRRSLVLVSSISLASGFTLLISIARRRPRFAGASALAALALFSTLAWAMPDPLDAVLARRYGGDTMLWREEGAQSTVSVHQGDHRVMYLDGLHQANDSSAMLELHRRIGTVAMVLNPAARDALVIGLGGGATAGAVGEFTGTALDIVELSPAVIRGAEWFRHANGDVLRRPHVRLHVDDGRNYLLLSTKPYDVVTADIIQPFHAGAGNLYSTEYFTLAKGRLRDNGVIVQWIGHRPESQYKLIARTFLEVFPYATAWAGGTLLAATKEPLQLSRSLYESRFADPVFARGAARAGIRSFEDVLGLYTAGPDELRRFVGDGPVLTDDRPLVEYFMSLPRGEADAALERLRGDVNRHIVP